MGIVIDLYPECEKPDWIKVGAICKCWGEANDLFIIDVVLQKSAVLSTIDGKYCHGCESFTKLHREGLE